MHRHQRSTLRRRIGTRCGAESGCTRGASHRRLTPYAILECTAEYGGGLARELDLILACHSRAVDGSKRNDPKQR
jgi:hypothetical protein